MSRLGNFATGCWKAMTCSKSSTSQQEHDDDGGDNSNNDNDNDNDNGNGNDDVNDPLVWCNDLEKHSCGEFSYAVAQANSELRTYSQIEIGSNAIFVGIYDGHVGPHTAKYINRALFTNLIGIARERGTISEQAIKDAITATEEGFLTLVQRAQPLEPMIVINGSCCLIGVIWKGTLFIAHIGNSRAVNGVIQDSDNNNILPLQMTLEHNVNFFWIRQEVRNSHPDDPNLVVQGDDGVWRIKGITQISRSIGDAYLKRGEFTVPSSLAEFQLPGALTEPALSALPFLQSRDIAASDRFFIFASREFWGLLTNHRAALIVYNNPRTGIARRLMKTALEEAARRAGIRYRDLPDIPKGSKRAIHDDIAVIVVFIDHDFVGQKDTALEQRSFKGFTDAAEQSDFRNIDDLM